ncbi:hypothetical protein N9O85_02385 [Porticoccaceae bacterium]|nr:hypothetical protein [Porticoccaceae bacterium]
MTQKSLGPSLAHGLSKRDSRESESRYDSLVDGVEGLLDGKQTKTSIFNRLVKGISAGLGDDIILKFSFGRSKKRQVTFICIEGHDAGGFSLVYWRIIKGSLDMDSVEPLWFTHHCMARVYQTFGVRSFKEFSLKHLDILLGLFQHALPIWLQHKRTPFPEDYIKELSLWHPKAEFKTYIRDGYLSLHTVISTAAMSPIKAKKGLEQARQDNRMIDMTVEKFLSAVKGDKTDFKYRIYR